MPDPRDGVGQEQSPSGVARAVPHFSRLELETRLVPNFSNQADEAVTTPQTKTNKRNAALCQANKGKPPKALMWLHSFLIDVFHLHRATATVPYLCSMHLCYGKLP